MVQVVVNRRMGLLTLVVLLVAPAPGYTHEPDCESARMKLRELRNAIERYQMSHGHYPAQRWWYRTLIWDGEVSDSNNEDPWGHPYIYELKGDSYDLFTVGYDGIRGTKDDQVMADAWQWGTCKSNRRGSCAVRQTGAACTL